MAPQQPSTPFSNTKQNGKPDPNQGSAAVVQAINLLYPLVPDHMRDPTGPYVSGQRSLYGYRMGMQVGSQLAMRQMGRGQFGASELATSQRSDGQISRTQVSNMVVKSEMSDAMDTGEDKGKNEPRYIFLYDKLQDDEVLEYCLNVDKEPGLVEAFLDGYDIDGLIAVPKLGCRLEGRMCKIWGTEEIDGKIRTWYQGRGLLGVTMQVMMHKGDCGLKNWGEKLEVMEDGEWEDMGVAVATIVYVEEAREGFEYWAKLAELERLRSRTRWNSGSHSRSGFGLFCCCCFVQSSSLSLVPLHYNSGTPVPYQGPSLSPGLRGT